MEGSWGKKLRELGKQSGAWSGYATERLSLWEPGSTTQEIMCSSKATSSGVQGREAGAGRGQKGGKSEEEEWSGEEGHECQVPELSTTVFAMCMKDLILAAVPLPVFGWLVAVLTPFMELLGHGWLGGCGSQAA